MDKVDTRLLKELDLSGVTITVRIEPNGTLWPVGGEFEKLLAAARERSLPRIHTVIVAEGQRKDIERIDPNLLKDDPHAEFRVICAETLTEAVQLLAVDAETRWGKIIDCTSELRRHQDFVGRQWLKERVQAFVDSHDSGYLLLTGGPGLGKSAFVAEQVREDQEPPVFHFIKRGMGDYWDDPKYFLHSLTAQLRRKYVLPQTEAEQDMTPSAAFVSVLQRVSRSLSKGQKAVIYVDGLDEAFGPTGRFAQVALPGILPRELPPGILMVLTSRPGEFLNWLADPRMCELQDLDPEAKDNLDDIHTYLRDQNQARKLGLAGAFVGQLAQATEGFFAAAVLYVRERPSLQADLQEWQQDPSHIPRGLTGWLREQWQRVLSSLPPEDPALRARWSPPPPEVVKSTLGLLATAREPLSRNHLMAFLRSALRQRAHQSSPPSIGFIPLEELGRHMNEVLRLSQEFFDSLGPEQGTSAPYRFFHTQFPEFITGELAEVERWDCHLLLAEGCAGWQRFQGAVRNYALRHRLAHLIEAQEWEQVAHAFAEADFIVERSGRSGFANVHADALAASHHPALPPLWQQPFREWEQFLRWRIERLPSFPPAYPQEVLNEFFSSAPKAWHNPLRALRDHFPPASTLYLRKTSGPPTLSNLGHTGWVNSVAFSPDGTSVVSGSSDSTVKVWEVKSGRCVNTLFFDREIMAVAFPQAAQLRLVVADRGERVFGYEVVER